MAYPMNKVVTIHSTNDLPTKHDGFKGVIIKQHHKYKKFFLIMVYKTGEEFYFHQSQII